MKTCRIRSPAQGREAVGGGREVLGGHRGVIGETQVVGVGMERQTEGGERRTGLYTPRVK